MRALARVANRIRMLVARGIVRLVDDGAGIQIVQVSAMKGETRAQLERFQQYGYTSVPFPGAEAVVLFVGGDRAHGLVLSIDDRRYRLQSLEPGEARALRHSTPEHALTFNSSHNKAK